MKPIVSICIPSFNRPDQLIELLRSVDCNPTKIEIIICEDYSQKRKKKMKMELDLYLE